MATIMEALDKKLGNTHKSMTIMEALGGQVGDTIDEVVKRKEITMTDNPLLALAMDFDIAADTDLLGKVIGDLQEDDMAVNFGKVTGTSHYVTEYTGWSGNPEEQEGNYVAFHMSVGELVIGTNVDVKINGKALDSDGIVVLRLNPAKSYKQVVFTAEADGHDTVTKIFDFSGVVKEAEEEE